MARFLFVSVIGAFILFVTLGIFYLKDSYMLLPIQASKLFAPPPHADWNDYAPPGGEFRVMLPAFPQHATQNVRDPKTKQLRHYNMYVAEQENGSIYMVNLIQFPESTENEELLKKTIVNDLMASNPTNQLKNMRVGDYKDFRTLDFSIVNNDTTLDGRAFVDGDTLYLLSAIYQNEDYNQEDYNYFIQSFDLFSSETTPDQGIQP